ncbi:MAG TPA: hypothetical protein VFQ65_25750, partial [Kofleriaceae bacterium]|nr:hypothetical protein [Kofleriaceae bacterium]
HARPVAGVMARLATTQRPPVFASVSLLAASLLLQPGPVRVVQVAPDALGPTPACIAAGAWHGDLYVPDGLWNMPIVHPQGHWRMPTVAPETLAPLPNVLAPGAVIPIGHWDSEIEASAIDVDRLVSGLKQLLATPPT